MSAGFPKNFLIKVYDTRCMMEAIEQVQSENMELFMEISNLRNNLNELYNQKGPASSNYISLSLKLNLLIKEYFDGDIS